MRTETASMVPPRRLGALLREARLTAGLALESLASEDLTVVDLDDIEHGRRLVDDELLQALVGLYGVEDAGLLPDRARLVIDLDEGRIAVDDDGVDADGVSDADAVLARYLALVYHLRELPIGSPIGLRDLDLDVLGTALALDTDDVSRRLTRLIAAEDVIARDQRRIRRRLLLPLVGVVIAAVTGGVLLLVAESGDEPGTSAEVDASGDGASANAARSVATDIGTGGAVEYSSPAETRLGTPGVEVNPTD